MASPLLSYSEAAAQVESFILALAAGRTGPTGDPEFSQPSTETVPLAAAAGRVLAEHIRADHDQPPFARSTRDGFACRAADASSHRLLSLTGYIRAGQSPSGSLGPGEAWEIMTGAPVPDGADAVFMVEHAEQTPDSVRINAPRTLQPGENIIPRAAEARAGDLLIPPGTRIGPAQIALAAQCGYSSLAVAARPRAAILSTGDELVPVESTPGPSQIRNSNSPMLAALVTAAGAIPITLPTVPDEESAVHAALVDAVDSNTDADLLLITGGISAGRFDLVEDALTRLGARFSFNGVAIQPGKPVVFGQIPRAGKAAMPFFALPGNPISSAVTFHLFGASLIAALGRDSVTLPRFALAKLAGVWQSKPGKSTLTRFLPAFCDFALAPTVELIPWQGSGDLAAFARSNCMVVIPQETTDLSEGSTVQILQI